jgi:putative ABC transport system permease protein
VLSERLAAHLDVQAGDTVEVQVLDGHRAKAGIRVNRVIREYVGLSAYMDRAALNRLTGDGEVADSAWLSIDEAQQADLFTRVKETPGIFTVSLQRQAYEKFRALLDQNIVTMLGFYVGFAAVIAFGVAYNAGRITFSERAHELATLRVLGYRKREVALILVGELALLTLVALALGCGIGYLLSLLMINLFATDLYQMPFGLAPATFAWSAMVVIVSTAISCAIVAWKVQNLDLVRVLKARD